MKTDCFAYDRRFKSCDALKGLYCTNKECKFYKTREENDKQDLQAKNNIKNKSWREIYERNVGKLQ